MTWNIAWSWQADERVATIAAVEGGVLVSAGLQLELLEADGRRRWKVDVPFKVHAATATQGAVGLLAAHGFYLLNTNDGSMVNEGRSAPGGFSDLAPRPGGGWALAGRRGEIHSLRQRPCVLVAWTIGHRDEVSFYAEHPPAVATASSTHGLKAIVLKSVQHVPSEGMWNTFPKSTVAALQQQAALCKRRTPTPRTVLQLSFSVIAC